MFFFDLDGTLIDSNGIWKQVDHDFLARRGLPYSRAYFEGVAHTALKKLDIEKYFENVTFAQQAGMHKKAPDVWLAAAEKNGVRPEDCTVFDDSLAACWGARAARMRVVGVHDSFFNKDEKEMRAFCDVYIDSFEELLYTPEQKVRRK